VVVEVVATESVAVAPAAPVMLTVDGTLHVAGLVAPTGLVVTAQLRSTVPVNPFEGVTLTVDVLPVVAPWLREMLPLLLSAKLAAPAVELLTIASRPSVWTYFPVESFPMISTL
jgi:hypothetical protein